MATGNFGNFESFTLQKSDHRRDQNLNADARKHRRRKYWRTHDESTTFQLSPISPNSLARRFFTKRLLQDMLFASLLPSTVHKLRTSILPKRLHRMHLHPILA